MRLDHSGDDRQAEPGATGLAGPQLGQNEQGQDLTPVDAIAVIKNDVAAMLAE
ncbi:hypothetical protein [Mycobacterium tuberculosis]|uniref:hypothetical protein n=1 Tax=Mycobacterium tuberculosis TaxID=1773 RepID=UPI001865A11A|nr:hypothetical protein [Mycobacterium tuberculosis]